MHEIRAYTLAHVRTLRGVRTHTCAHCGTNTHTLCVEHAHARTARAGRHAHASRHAARRRAARMPSCRASGESAIAWIENHLLITSASLFASARA